MSGFGLGANAKANALTVNTSLDVDGATTLDQVTIDTTDGDFSVSGANKISLDSSSTAVDAIKINASNAAGGITIGSSTGGEIDIGNVTSITGPVTMTSTSSSETNGIHLSNTSGGDILLRGNTTVADDVQCITPTGTWSVFYEWFFLNSATASSGSTSMEVTSLADYDMYKIFFVCNSEVATTGTLQLIVNNRTVAGAYRVATLGFGGASTTNASGEGAFIVSLQIINRCAFGEIVIKGDNKQIGAEDGYPISFYVGNSGSADNSVAGTFFPSGANVKITSLKISIPSGTQTFNGFMHVFGKTMSLPPPP